MKHSARLNRIYNDLLYKDRFNTPFFILYDHQEEKGYYVYKNVNDHKKSFKTLSDANIYIQSMTDDPLIILLDFHTAKND